MKALALLLVLAAPAWAQSKRYPPDADPDDDSGTSNLWEAALHPATHHLLGIIRKASRP